MCTFEYQNPSSTRSPHPPDIQAIRQLSLKVFKVGLPVLASHIDYNLLRSKKNLHMVYNKYVLINQLID